MKELQKALEAIRENSDGELSPVFIVGENGLELDFGDRAVAVADAEEAITMCMAVNAAISQLHANEKRALALSSVQGGF